MLKKFIYILATAVLAIAVTACGASSGQHTGENLEEGDMAPVFTAEMADGSTINIEDLQGKPAFVNFWATWCGYCVSEMPDLQKLYEEYGDDVQFIMIDCEETTDEVNAFISDNPYTFPYAYDTDGSIADLYPTQGIPLTAVIGKDGTVEKIFRGAYPYEEYKAAIEGAL